MIRVAASNQPSDWMQHPGRRVGVMLAIASAYFLLGQIGLHWAVLQENTSVVWPASGFAMAALFRMGHGIWPGIFLGAVATVLTTPAPAGAALTIGLGNTLEPALAVWLYRHFMRDAEPLEALRPLITFLACMAIAGPLVSALTGMASLGFIVGVPSEALPRLFLTWWLGNMAGVLLVAPLLLAWIPLDRELPANEDPTEWFWVMLATVVLSGIAFVGWSQQDTSHYPLAFMPYPLVIWAALRLGLRGGILATFLMIAMAIYGSTQGSGPFIRESLDETFALLLVYMVVGSSTMLFMSVLIHERQTQQENLSRTHEELERRVVERTRDLSEANLALQASEARLRMVITEAPLILWCLDRGGCFTLLRGRALQAIDLRPEDMLGRAVSEVFAGNPEILARCQRVLAGEQIREYLPIRDRIFEVHAVPVKGDEEGAIGVCIDVTERARAEEKLKLDATVFANTAEGVLMTDRDGNIIAVNKAFTEITGYGESEVLGQNPRMLRSDRQESAFYEAMWQQLVAHGRWQGEIWNRRKNGEVYPELLDISAVCDHAGEVTHYVAVFSDISALKLSQQQLDYLAYHDPLTGLANRLLFSERLGHAIQRAAREKHQLAVLFIDLDHFKHVNDSMGHPAGDRLLVQVANRLLEAIRGDDTVARLGGDEFVVLAERVGHPEDIAGLARKLLSICEAPFDLDGRDVYLGASIGISVYPQDGEDAQHLVKNADAALYLAKDEGRNTFSFYTDELTQRAMHRVEMETELRQALENDEFELFYQPQKCLVTGQVLAVEALIRWRHPRRGLLAPGAFLPTAEACGLIVPIGTWVLQVACRQMAEWLEAGYALEHMAVNLAAEQIEREGLEQAVEAALSAAGLNPYFLELEITEGALALERAEHTLRSLKTLGLRLAVDDFGTGFSSLSYLKRFTLDTLKIDRAFVAGCEQDSENAAIVRSLLVLGQGLKLSVVAEGVETVSEKEWLQGLGCDVAQGYLFSKPLPAVEVVQHFIRDPGVPCREMSA